MNILLHDRYRIEAVLGIGGQAVVYRAVDEQLNVNRAIKVLSPQLMYEDRARQRFEAEARIMAGLDHPNVAQIYDIVSTKRYLFIVMELLGNQSLWDWVKHNGKLPEQTAVDMLAPILDLLQKAHEQGIVHRDIKPSNILISPSGQTKLTDFGIAHIQPKEDDTQFTKTGTIMGTWGYMSPEQRQNSKSVDARADIYALGATLFALVTARRPVDLFASIQDESLLEGLSPTMMAIIQNCTSYTPADRYASIKRLKEAIEASKPHLQAPPEDFKMPMGQAPADPTASHNHPDILSLMSLLSDSNTNGSQGANTTFDFSEEHTAVLPSTLKRPFFSTMDITDVEKTIDKGLSMDDKTQDYPKPSIQTSQDSLNTARHHTITQPPVESRSNRMSLLVGLLILAGLTSAALYFRQTIHPSSLASEHHTCQLLAQTLLEQQHEDGGFSGIPQLPSSLWDTAQQLTALKYSQKCGINTEAAEEKAIVAMQGWSNEDNLKWQHAYGASWFYVSTAGLNNEALTAQSQALLDSFRLSSGAYAVTAQALKDNMADPYATTMAAWGMYMHQIANTHPPYQDTVMRLKNILETGQVSEISGLEEQAWWTLWMIGQRHPEFAPSEGLNLRVAKHMSSRCKWDETHQGCDMPTWPSGKIEFTQVDGKPNSLVTQGLPWASIAANALIEAPGLSPELQQDMQLIADWTHHRLCDAPETLAQSPGYILSESLVAIVLQHHK